jgi:hypothetical protein
MDFYDQFSEVIWNGATSTLSAAVPEPGTWPIIILGFGMLGWHLRQRRTNRDKLSSVVGGEGPLSSLLSGPPMA